MTQSNTSVSFQRAMILHQQRRYGDAERELRQALAADPFNAEMHAMLALCLTELKQYPQATEEAQQAIGLAPDLPFPHYSMAKVMFDRVRYKESLAAVEQALALDAQNPTYLALLSAIRFQLRQWPAALAAAERGLAINPEHERCVNLRAMALVKLGRRDEAGAAIGAALARRPEDALTHANQGWTLLHQGDHRKAMEHFREALRLNPEMEWARAGMVESLKARNPIYKVMLAYFLFMGRLSRRAQWAIIVGGYVGIRAVVALGQQSTGFRPLVLPLILLYLAFAIMTWIAYPLFNLLLRLDRFGRYALSVSQTWAANCTGIVLLAAIGLLAMAAAYGSANLVFAALAMLFFTIPVAVVFRAPVGWPQYVLIAYAAALLVLLGILLYGVVPSSIHHEPEPQWSHQVFTYYLWGGLLHQFVANALLGVQVKR